MRGPKSPPGHSRISNLHEYAHREWSGLLIDFYKPRWEMFFQYLRETQRGNDVDKPDFYKFEKKWTEELKVFPKTDVDACEAAQKMYDKYYMVIAEGYNK